MSTDSALLEVDFLWYTNKRNIECIQKTVYPLTFRRFVCIAAIAISMLIKHISSSPAASCFRYVKVPCVP